MNISIYTKHESIILIISELRKKYNEIQQLDKKINKKPGIKIEEMNTAIKKEAVKRGIANLDLKLLSPTGLHQSEVIFTKEYRSETTLAKKLLDLNEEMFRYVLSSGYVEKSPSLTRVIPKHLETHRKLTWYTFNDFLQKTIKDKSIQENDYESLENHKELLKKELRKCKEIRNFFNTLKNLEKYRKRKTKEFVNKYFEYFLMN